MLALLGGLALGFLLGLRHALEPDHLAALSTLLAERPGFRRGLLAGASWGIGHGLALLLFAGPLLLFRAHLPPALADGFELLVALMLVVLGARAIVRAARDGSRGPALAHTHGDDAHTHRGAADHLHLGRLTLSRRPLVVGMIHGLAGSGALTALAFSGAPSTTAALAYVALFAVGGATGMALLSGLAGWPLSRVAGRPLSAAAGVLSLAMGVAWGWPLVTRFLT
jgi:hypothetical protein